MKVLLTHPGTQHSYKLANELYRQNKLLKFCTRFAISNNSMIYKAMPKTITSKLQTRITGIPSNKLYTLPWLEVYYQYVVRTSAPWYRKQYEMHELFQKSIPDRLIEASDVIIGFDTASHVLVERAKKHNKTFILDRTIGHPASQSNTFSLLYELYPEWRANMPIKEKKYIEYEQYEHDSADLIVAPSQFVKNTLVDNGVDENKIVINPFGTNLGYFSEAFKNRGMRNERLNFLFFGSISARKGVPTLLKAWSKVQSNQAHLTLAGFGDIPKGIKLPDNVSFLGVIAPNDRAKLFSEADVFVFPSFFEGFAQVQIEAAASGLPLITTKNAGGDEIVTHNKNGILIEPGDVDQLIEAITFFIDNPNLIEKMGAYSRQEAVNKFAWSHYRERWSNILDLVM